jgi:hypothetical protein
MAYRRNKKTGVMSRDNRIKITSRKKAKKKVGRWPKSGFYKVMGCRPWLVIKSPDELGTCAMGDLSALTVAF